MSDHQELFDAAQKWADKHIEETGHTVWLHRRKFDVAVACFTCIDNSNRGREE